jgi:C-terminal peptidase prc
MLLHRGRTAFVVLLIAAVVAPYSGLDAQDEPVDVESEVKTMIRRLEKADDGTFWLTAGRLADLGPRAVPPLKAALPDLSPRARLGVASALIDLGEESLGTGELVAIAGDKEKAGTKLRVAAIEVLGVKGTADVEDRIQAMLDDVFDPHVRIALATTLWELTKDLRAKQELKKVIRSTDENVKIAGALALAGIGDMEPVRKILKGIEDEPTARGRLAKALIEKADWREIAYRQRAAAAAPTAPRGNGYSDKLLKLLIAYVREYYLDADDLTEEDLLQAAAKGIMDALDPPSMYFTPKDRFDWYEDLNPEYGGIGSYVNFVGEYFTISRPMFGGPAYEIGLKPGDRILRVDGWETTGKTTTDIVKRLRGKPGTKVIVTVYREGWDKPEDFTIERKLIRVPTVNARKLPGNVGYLRLSTFGMESADEVEKALFGMESEGDGLKALVLDLRYNTGGLMSAAENICDLFLDKDKLVVYWQGKNPRVLKRREWKTKRGDPREYPLILLVNGVSASASEITAGCLQFYRRALIVGMRTYGKGSVQNLYPLYVSPPAEPWTDKDKNGRWDKYEPYRDLNENGKYDAGEDFYDRNRNGQWDDTEPFEDKNGNGVFDFPAAKITIAKYYLPNGFPPRREKKVIDGKITWVGGITPDVWIDGAKVDGWRNNELLKLERTNSFDNYLAKQYASNQELIEKLADYDGGSPKDYPEFEEFFKGLDTKLNREEVWWWLRVKTRRKVGDERGREMVGDYVQDQQLQVGILEALKQAGIDAKSIPEYKAFADREFPEVPEEQRLAAEGTNPTGR